MPNTPLQYIAACPAQGSTTAVATLGQGQTFPVNFSGIPDSSSNPSTFTVGGWVRRQSVSASGTIFAGNGQQLTITMDSNGVITASVGNGQIVSEIPVTDVLWHFVAVSYLPSIEQNETGILMLYIDGIEAAGGAVDVTTTGQGSGCTLGATGAPFEFISWSIFSQALPSDVIGAPEWGKPLTDTKAANVLVAAFDFSVTPPSDLSGNSYLVSVAAQCTHTPCALLNAGGTLVLGASNLTPGEGSGTPGAFTIMGWANIPTPVANAAYMLFMNGDRGLMIVISSNASNNLLAGYAFGSTNFQATPVGAGVWHHYALTWDGTATVTFYLDGQVANTQRATPTGFTAHDPTIGNAESGSWNLQGLSMWSTCLSAATINSYIQGADPSEQPGCVASFPLLSDFGDSTNGAADAVVPTGCSITDLVVPVTSSVAVTAPAVQKSAVPAGPQILLPHELRAIARNNGIDVDTPLSEAEMAGPNYADIGQWFDGLTASLPTKAAARLKNEFLRNARTGLELRRKGIQAGTFTSAVEGGDTVFYYHTEAGPQEVYRQTGTVPTRQEWATTIVFDVIGLLTAMFGIVTTVPNIQRAMARLQPRITALMNAIQQAINASDSDLLKAKR